MKTDTTVRVHVNEGSRNFNKKLTCTLIVNQFTY